MASEPTLVLTPEVMTAVKATPMTKVESQLLKEIGYNEPNRIMRVRFTNNTVYLYSGITKKMYDEFARAESKGVWFGKNIRAHASLYPFAPEPKEE
jgi:hypothetical protein